MTLPDILGFIGVFLILVAYLLNLLNKITSNSLPYALLNFLGASLACMASIVLKYAPFIILEGIWALVSLIASIKAIKNKVKK